MTPRQPSRRGVALAVLLVAMTVTAVVIAVPPSRADAAACTVSTTTRLGSSGAAVTCVERRLVALGYSLMGPDTYFGTTTERAVLDYQRAKGLVVDGVVGRQTATSLGIWRAPRYVSPVPGGSYGGPHAGYPAVDIFRACGAWVVAPVAGRILEVDRVDDWSATTDSPWARGGRSITIRGDDRVRHYLAHFASIGRRLRPGMRVTAGQTLGRMGDTGRAGACHTHYGISRTCPDRDWWVRRGVVAPQPFLSDWGRGVMTSPAAAVRSWTAAHPGACSDPAVIGAH